MREVYASAPGKVNLVLRSAVQGDDGYHQLFTTFEAVGLREYVVARTRRRPGIGVTTFVYHQSTPDGIPVIDEAATASLADLPPEQHLAVRAAKALQPLAAATGWGPTSSGMELVVHKTVPEAGGMAGGSADAAAALVAASELWQLGLDLDQLLAVGRTLGADVPACILGGTSLGVGRGDTMTALGASERQHWWAVAFHTMGLSTPAVFREFDRLGLGVPVAELPTEVDDPRDLLGSAETLATRLVNDLAPAALSLRSELADIGRIALDAGAAAWMISGSGPTVVALAASAAQAQLICDAWRGTAGVRGTTVTSGPSEGARVEAELPVWARSA